MSIVYTYKQAIAHEKNTKNKKGRLKVVFKVICIKEPADKKGYVKSTTYDAGRNSPESPIWVGTLGERGEHFSDEEFREFFQEKK